MTTSEAGLPTGRSNGHPAGGRAEPAPAGPPPAQPPEPDLLERLRDSALGLLAGLDRQPRLLRIRTDRVELELEWPTAGSVTEAAPAGAPAVAAAVEAPPAGQYLAAHMVGVFYRAPQPGADPFIEVGDVITRGQQVGIIEAMKLMLPVESDLAGRVVEVLVSDGAAVEYGDRLFAVEPTDS